MILRLWGWPLYEANFHPTFYLCLPVVALRWRLTYTFFYLNNNNNNGLRYWVWKTLQTTNHCPYITCFWVLVTYLSLLCEKNKDLHHGSSHTNFKSLNCTKILTLMSASDVLFTDMPTKVNNASVGQWICNSSLICQQLLWWFISILKKKQHKVSALSKRFPFIVSAAQKQTSEPRLHSTIFGTCSLIWQNIKANRSKTGLW